MLTLQNLVKTLGLGICVGENKFLIEKMLTLLIQSVSLRVGLTPRVRVKIEEKSSLF